MATSVEEWLELESDPGLFTMLLENIGVKGVQVEDVYDLTEEIKEEVFGFVFLFKWRDESKKNKRTQSNVNSSASDYNKTNIITNGDSKNIMYESDPDKLNQIYFAHQIIPNSCATNALLSVLMNCSERITLGAILTRFRDNTLSLSPEKRGFALGSMPELADAHNKRARYLRSECQNNYHSVTTASLNTPATRNMFNENDPDADETYHFVSYVQIGDGLYELDGLQPYPIKHGTITNSNWTKPCLNIIRNRMLQKSEHFSLMAVVRDRRKVLAEQLTVLNKNRSILQQALFQMDQDNDGPQKRESLSNETVEEKKYNDEMQKNDSNNNTSGNGDGSTAEISGNVSEGSGKATNGKRRTSNRVSLRNQRKMDMMKKNLEQSASTDDSRSSDAAPMDSALDVLKPISIDIGPGGIAGGPETLSSPDNQTTASSGSVPRAPSKYPTRSSTRRDTLASNSLAQSRSSSSLSPGPPLPTAPGNGPWPDPRTFPSFSADQLRHLLQVVDDTIVRCKAGIADEIEKRNRYLTDDLRRSFNYDDFIHTFLFALKRQGLLEQLLLEQRHRCQTSVSHGNGNGGQTSSGTGTKRAAAPYRSSTTGKRIKLMASGGQDGSKQHRRQRK